MENWQSGECPACGQTLRKKSHYPPGNHYASHF